MRTRRSAGPARQGDVFCIKQQVDGETGDRSNTIHARQLPIP